MPTVSVILPTFNRTRHLSAAVESVLCQTFGDWEMIIADDGSNEDTRAYLRSLLDPRILKVWLPHSGNPSRVRNHAIRRASGFYLAFIDSDDTWAPQKLERQVALLNERSDRKWSSTSCDRIDEGGNPIAEPIGKRRVPLDGWIWSGYSGIWETSSPWPRSWPSAGSSTRSAPSTKLRKWCEDYDLYLRLSMKSAIASINEPLCSIRTHGEHYSANRIGEYESRMRLYTKLEDLLKDPRLRSLCRQKRAEHSLIVAGLHFDQREHLASWRTLGRALGYSWSYPAWWLGALRASARPFVPTPLLNAYRHCRR